MIVQTAARSISRQVKTWLDRGQSVTRTTSVFRSACNLATDGDDMIALVTPRIGDGPFNIVLDTPSAFGTTIGSETNVTATPDRLIVGHLEIDLTQAVIWEPYPKWQMLRAQWQNKRSSSVSQTVAFCIDRLHVLCARHARHSVLVPLIELGFDKHSRAPTGSRSCRHDINGISASRGTPGKTLEQAILGRARKGLSALCAGWDGDRPQLREGALALAGLGGGLTPAGDDFLVGAMLYAWLAHPAPGAFCRILAETAAPRTNRLSAAFLRAASRGQCSAAWHALLAASAAGTPLNEAVHGIVTYGATSGADALIGFLCLASYSRDIVPITVGEIPQEIR